MSVTMNKNVIVCQACLSVDRTLFPIGKMNDLDSLRNLELTNFNLNDSGLCWECKRIVEKFTRFRKQAELAQSTLQQTEKLQRLQCLSTLSSSGLQTYTYLFNYSDPTNDDCDTIDIESKQIKHETEIDDHDYQDGSVAELDVFIQEEVKKENLKKKVKKLPKVKKKKKTNTKVDNKDVRDKFVEVEFTEEEMVKSREDKRSHPNFKKLPFNCGSCVLGFTREEKYDLHMEKKHDKNIGPHICPVCLVRFANPTTQSKHTNKHYHCYRCKLCTYETSELWSALSHCRTKHKKDSENCIHCGQCSYVAKSREELAEHTKTQHCLICNECGEKFKGPNTLRTHIRRIHGSVREYKCDSCPRAFRSRGRMEAHAAAHGPAAAARLAYCAVCRVQYKNLYVYRNHLVTSANHSERRYHCDECGKKFASKVYYTRHYRFYHQKQSNFKCEICDKLFISDWRLRNHMQLRHGAARSRNHACDQCGKKFYTGSTLKAHQLTHSAQRTFLCADCGDSFRQRPALYTHARLVHRRLQRTATTV